MRGQALFAALVIIAGCHSSGRDTLAPPEAGRSRYLFVWAGDADKRESDFLAVVDIDRNSRTYADVVTTVPVGAVGTLAHHTEYEMPSDGVLWANGFSAGRTFRFDLRDPKRPRLAGSLGNAGPFSHPHSFARLPGGNVLATFQHLAAETPPPAVSWNWTPPVEWCGTAQPLHQRWILRFGPTALPSCLASIESSQRRLICTCGGAAGRFRYGACPT